MSTNAVVTAIAEPHYEYRWEDHSLLTKYLRDPVFVPLVHALPRSITPNQLTVFGHAIVWLMFAIAMAVREPGPILLATLGLSFLVYALADCIDGMFARHTNRTSRIGELLDHGFDAITLPLVTLGTGLVLRMPAWLVVASTAAVAFMAFATFVHGYRIGCVVLGAIGSLEGIVAAGIICLVAAAIGVDPLATPGWFGLSPASWLAIAIVGGSFLALLSMTGLVRHVADFAPLLLACAAATLWFAYGALSVGMAGLLFVAVCGYEVCILTCSRLVRTPLRLWDIGLTLIVLAGATASLAAGLDARTQTILAALVPAYTLARGGPMFAHAIRTLRTPAE